jgi:UDP-4-amino-4,6-dideoxy-N-acetyl-beta-L-altrosamine transaminase
VNLRAPRLVEEAPSFLPYGRQQIDEADIEAVVEILRSDFLTGGPAIGAFERGLAETVAAPHAVACASGTAALHLAMRALDIGPGDLVIAPTITFLSTPNAARFCGADVLFCDVHPDTGLMTPATLREAIARADGRRIKAILPVHFGGGVCAMEEIAAIAKEIGAAVVEDCCHALGSMRRDGPVGDCRHSVMSVFSFHPVKTIAAGEAGAVTTRDPALDKRLRALRNHGVARDAADFVDPEFSRDADGGPAPWAYEMQALGFNYRMTDIEAALGLSQLKKLPAFAARRRALSSLYGVSLAPLKIDYVRMNAGACPHLFITLLDFSKTPRRVVMERLRAAGIGTQVHYMPIHRQPYYKALYGARHLPGAEAYYARCLTLPLHAGMGHHDVMRVVAALGEALT